MPERIAVLGQAAPLANADTDLYTVPAATSTVGSTVTVCNRSATVQAKFRVAVRPGGVGISNQHYVYYDAPLGPNSTVAITIGMTLGAGAVVTVRADVADTSWSLFGTEITT